MNTAQVLRTSVPGLKTNAGNPVPPNTRVVVMSSKRVSEDAGTEKVKVKVVDPDRENLAGQWFSAAPGAFHPTRRGRPPIAK
jgi:hypothetical protein